MRKGLGLFFLLLGPVFCLAQSPDGWKAVHDQKDIQRGFLGEWESDGESARVKLWTLDGKSWLAEVMDSQGLDTGIAPQEHPVHMEPLPKPYLGMKTTYLAKEKEEGTWSRFGFVVMTDQGGYDLKVSSIKKEGFDLGKWTLGNAVEDPGNVLRNEFKKAAQKFNEDVKHLRLRPIKIDGKLNPPVSKGGKKPNSQKLEVRVSGDGIYPVNGVVQDKKSLVELMKKAVEKEPKTVLHVKAAKEVDFEVVRRLIRLGARAGLDRVAYGAF